MTYEEICDTLDIEGINDKGVYPLDYQDGEVAGGQPYRWSRERFFMLGVMGVTLITCFQHCGVGEGCFAVEDWSYELQSGGLLLACARSRGIFR